MNIAVTKLDLVKKLLNTNDKGIIDHLKVVFSTEDELWREEYPDEIRQSIEIGIKQSESGQTIPHEEVMKRFGKWLKK
jgi:hypothetical protein